VLDLLLATLRSLRAHALRFSLTSLGIVWGAMMLVFLSATMEGIDRHFKRELEEVGPKIIILWPGSVLKNRVGERGARPVKLDEDDVDAVQTLHSVEDVAPDIVLWSQIVRAGRRTKLLMVNGASERSQAIRNFQVAEGRFLTPTDVERRERVAFLGAEAARRLFGDEPVLGRRIQIEGVAFRVIGVAQPKGDQLVHVNGKDDTLVVVPWTTARRWLEREDHFEQVIFSSQTPEASFGAVDQSRDLLALRHAFPPSVDTALSYLNFHEILRDIYNVQLGLRIFLMAAGAITLLVGAMGVMNIMLVVIGERTVEIGLRKAVGASSRAIFLQFLAEAAAVCGISGLLGAGLGIAMTQLLGGVSPPGTPTSSPPVLDPVTLVAVVVSLVVTGMLAGVLPALRAARVPPSEALRGL
jgi:putative ABC transport system permease protein